MHKTPLFLVMVLILSSPFIVSAVSTYNNSLGSVFEYDIQSNSYSILDISNELNIKAESLDSFSKWTIPLSTYKIIEGLEKAEGKAIISFFTFTERDQALDLLEKQGISIENVYRSIPAVKISYTSPQISNIDFSPLRVKYVSQIGKEVFSLPQNLDTTLGKPVDLSDIRKALEIDQLHNIEDQNGTFLFGNNITIAVLDSGIESSFKCLNKKATYLGDNNIELTDENKVIYSFNAVPGEDVNDLSGHGTHIASILAGNGFYVENGIMKYIGEYGIVPGASLMNIKVLNASGYGKDEWLVDGFDKTMENEIGLQADIISASLTSITFQRIGDPLHELILEAGRRGIIIVTSSGNYGPSGSTVGSPAIWENVISVGSTSNLRDISLFSSSGPTYKLTPGVDVLAPGKLVLGLNHTSGEKKYLSGTSISTPIVSGIIALLKQAFPNRNSSQIESSIIDTADDLNKPIVLQGNGLIDPLNAYNWLKENNEQTFTIIPKRISPSNLFYYSSVEGVTSTFNVKVIASDNQYISNFVIGDDEIIQIADTIQLTKGWNIFSFNISLPMNQPIQNYHTVISLYNDKGFKQNIVIDIQSRYYTGSVLFDISHDNDIYNNSWFGGSTPYGSHLYLSRILKDRGYAIETFSGGNLTNALENIDILVISDPELAFQPEEIQIIDDFVSNGGSLLFLINSYRLNVENINDDPLFSSNYTAVNEVLELFGAEIESGYEKTLIPYKSEFNSKLTDITTVENSFFWGSCVRFINKSANVNNNN
ncbi:MAG: S8 family serine peptidase, partial [Candidatus Heimdallarchaeaceae archaeon]